MIRLTSSVLAKSMTNNKHLRSNSFIFYFRIRCRIKFYFSMTLIHTMTYVKKFKRHFPTSRQSQPFKTSTFPNITQPYCLIWNHWKRFNTWKIRRYYILMPSSTRTKASSSCFSNWNNKRLIMKNRWTIELIGCNRICGRKSIRWRRWRKRKRRWRRRWWVCRMIWTGVRSVWKRCHNRFLTRSLMNFPALYLSHQRPIYLVIK